MKNTYWLSAYIYYKDKPEKLLKHEIYPLVQKVLSKSWAEQSFFIRYGDSRGPHIRLRFQGDQATLEKHVKPLLEKTFPKIRFVRYAPEFKRYGGKNGVRISEKLFAASSKAILSYINEQPDDGYQRYLGMALQLNLSMMHALGMDRKEAQAFFAHSTARDIEHYEAHLAQQSDTILPFLNNLWEALDQQVDISTPWFVDWHNEVQQIGKELQTAYKENKLRDVDPKNTHKQNPLWFIYESYLHMNNNRLGIVREDEGFAAYIISKGLAHNG